MAKLSKVPEETQWVVHQNNHIARSSHERGVHVARGRTYGDARELTFAFIKGPVRVEGHAQTPPDDDGMTRVHTRVALRRGDEWFVAGCHATPYPNEWDIYYLAGPMTLDELIDGYEPGKGYNKIHDEALVASMGYAFVEEI